MNVSIKMNHQQNYFPENIEDLDPHRMGCIMSNACYYGRVDIINQVLDMGYDPNKRAGTNIAYTTPLLYAACNGNIEVMELLRSHGADLNHVDEYGRNALKSTVSNRHYEATRWLLDQGVDANVVNHEGLVALNIVCDQCQDADDKFIRLLLPVTDSKYYQKSFEFCKNEKVRNVFKELCPHMTFVDPPNGFGGPMDKMHEQYNTPPTDPVLRQFYDILTILEEKLDDPNDCFLVILVKTSFSGRTEAIPDDFNWDSKLLLFINRLFHEICEEVNYPLDLRNENVPLCLSEWPDIYKAVRNYYLKTFEVSQDDQEQTGTSLA